jgi:hypothetical protein
MIIMKRTGNSVIFNVLLIAFSLSDPCFSHAQNQGKGEIDVWLTNSDRSALFAEQP